jgi:hypothetical protein
MAIKGRFSLGIEGSVTVGARVSGSFGFTQDGSTHKDAIKAAKKSFFFIKNSKKNAPEFPVRQVSSCIDAM